VKVVLSAVVNEGDMYFCGEKTQCRVLWWNKVVYTVVVWGCVVVAEISDCGVRRCGERKRYILLLWEDVVWDAMIAVLGVVVKNMSWSFVLWRCVVDGVVSDCSVECCGERMRHVILLWGRKSCFTIDNVKHCWTNENYRASKTE